MTAMVFRIRQFLALTRLTAVEALRQPLSVLLTASCVTLTALVPLTLIFQYGEEGRLARDSGLAFHFVLGLLVAGYAACSTLSREIEEGTASMALSKPLGRGRFFLAKFAGISLVVVIFSFCAIVATLLGERAAERYIEDAAGNMRYVTDRQTALLLLGAPMVAYGFAAWLNYRFRRPYQSAVFALIPLVELAVLLVAACFDRDGHWAPFHFRLAWRVVPAGVLVTLALIVFSALALALTTRLSTVPTLGLCAALLVLGLMSEHWFGRLAGESRAAGICYRLLPNWQPFWVSDMLTDGRSVAPGYLLRAGFHAAAYTAGALLLGMASFRRREMK